MSRTLLSSVRRTAVAAARANCAGGGCCNGRRLRAATGDCSGGLGGDCCSGARLGRAFSTTPPRAYAAATAAAAAAAAANTTATIPVRVQGTGTGTVQALSVPGKPYTFASDTYTTLGGTDASPSPVVYSLASLGACTQVTGSLVARDLGLRLGRWTVDVEGALPTAVLVTGAEGNPNWVRVALRVRVQTDAADDARFQHFAHEVERRCPITALFTRSGVPVDTEWVNEKL